MGRACSKYGGEEKFIQRFGGETGGQNANGSKKKGWGAWSGLNCLKIRDVAGYCECGNEPLVSIKCGEFLG
jgi:hypothetical protein